MIRHCTRNESHGQTLFTFPMPGLRRPFRVLTKYPFKERAQFEVAEIETNLNYYLSKWDKPEEWEKLKWKIVELFPKSRPLRRLECFQETQATNRQITGETLVSELLDRYLTDYQKEHPKTAKKVAPHIKPVRDFFESELFGAGKPAKVKDLTEANVKLFRAYRRDTPSEKTGNTIAPATINANLNHISGALKFAGLPVPELHLYNVTNKNQRMGFFELEDLEAFVRHLPPWLENLVRFEFLLGWRISETLSRRMKVHVDMKIGELRVLPGESKNNHPRTISLNDWPELKGIIQDQIDRFPSTMWLFHREGNEIKYNTFWEHWAKARKLVNEERKNAGLPPFELGVNGLEHDFRRTAARNLYRTLKDQYQTNYIMGWEPNSQMLVRYNIITAEDIRGAIAKIGRVLRPNYPKNTQTSGVFEGKSLEILGNSD